MTTKQLRHPRQPLVRDKHGTVRFHQNTIVRYLLDHGGIGLNQLLLLTMPQRFTDDDWDQFYQLIGYSVCGYSEIAEGSETVSKRSANLAWRQMERLFPVKP